MENDVELHQEQLSEINGGSGVAAAKATKAAPAAAAGKTSAKGQKPSTPTKGQKPATTAASSKSAKSDPVPKAGEQSASRSDEPPSTKELEFFADGEKLAEQSRNLVELELDIEHKEFLV